MPDVFISYSSRDEKLAAFVQAQLQAFGLDVFRAAVSVRLGIDWDDEILKHLRESTWVIFLATQAACRSPWVQQELGGAVLSAKRLIPICWDVPPSELPGWVKRKQALDLRGKDPATIQRHVQAIAAGIRGEKNQQQLLLIGLVVLAGIGVASLGRR